MKRIRRILVGMLLIIVCAGGFVAGKGYRMYQEALEEKSLVQIRKETVEDENFVSAEQLPDIYKKAVVSVEDKRFYRHKGIDPIGIARAFYHNIRARKLLEGGSTITQQVAKNFYFDMDQTVERKIAEIFMAIAMEKEFTKEEILELYVNHIYFGDGYDCVREASLGYFHMQTIHIQELLHPPDFLLSRLFRSFQAGKLPRFFRLLQFQSDSQQPAQDHSESVLPSPS